MYLKGTYVYLWAKYLKMYWSTSTQVHEKYLSTYLSTNVLKYSSLLTV